MDWQAGTEDAFQSMGQALPVAVIFGCLVPPNRLY